MGDSGGCRWGVRYFLWAGPLALVLALFAVAAPPAGSPAAAMDSEEMTFLTLINQYRASNGLGLLSVDSKLNDTARWMAQDLAANDYFSHTDSLGRDPFRRMDDFGYDYNTWRGENLVAGTEGAQASLDMWEGSPGHNANMLNANYTVIGIGRVYGPASTFGWYWATEFGGQADPAPPRERPVPPPAPEPQTYAPPPASGPAPETASAPPAPSPTPTAAPALAVRLGPVITPTPTATPAGALGPHWWQIGRILQQWSQHFTAVRQGGHAHPAFWMWRYTGVRTGLLVFFP